MAWEDMGLYWAWRGGPDGYTRAPTKKHIVYARAGARKTAVAVIENDAVSYFYEKDIKDLMSLAFKSGGTLEILFPTKEGRGI